MLTYLLLITYLAVQYLQPGVKIPALAALRPAFLVGILLAIAATLQMTNRTRPIVFPRQSKRFLGLIALMAASLLTALNREGGLTTLEVMATNFVVYFILTQVVDTRRRLKGLLWAFVAIHLFVGIDGVRSFYNPIGKTEGATGLKGVLSNFLGDTNDFAMALVVAMPFAYSLMLHSRSWLAKGALVGCVTLHGAGIMSTLSRGGQLGLLAVLGAIGARSNRKKPVLVLLLSLGLLFALFAPQQYWGRVASIGNYGMEASAQARFYTWRAGLQMGLTHPLLGVGPGSYVTAYRIGFYGDRPKGISGLLTAHSTYFLILAELGLTGLGIFIAMAATNFQTCGHLLRQARAGKSLGPGGDIVTVTAAACQVSLVGFLVSGTFLSAAYYPHFWYLTGFITIADSLARERTSARSAEPVVQAGAGVTPGRVLA